MSTETAVLKGGVVVGVAELRYLWTLEERGTRFRLDAEGGVHVVGRLSDDDRAFLATNSQLVFYALTRTWEDHDTAASRRSPELPGR